MLTIIAYHYVRDLPRTRYPQIKGLSTARFEGQLDYIQKYYTVCGGKQVISAFRGEEELPPNPCWLTFDDGFIDHFITVVPRLVSRGMVGSFYPPGKAVEERQLLNSHKIHFILASMNDHRKLVEDFFELLKAYRRDYDLPQDEILYRTHVSPPSQDGDPSDTVFIKRVQHVLPEEVRSAVTADLFEQYVKDDEAVLSEELYMDIPQLRFMARNGMEIGGHGYSHVRLDNLTRDEQEEEIRRTVSLLAKVYEDEPSDWVMSYPFGRYNNLTLELLKEAGCTLGLGVGLDLVHDRTTPFDLNRLDTNDLPFSDQAEISQWTKLAQQTTPYASVSHA